MGTRRPRVQPAAPGPRSRAHSPVNGTCRIVFQDFCSPTAKCNGFSKREAPHGVRSVLGLRRRIPLESPRGRRLRTSQPGNLAKCANLGTFGPLTRKAEEKKFCGNRTHLKCHIKSTERALLSDGSSSSPAARRIWNRQQLQQYSSHLWTLIKYLFGK